MSELRRPSTGISLEIVLGECSSLRRLILHAEDADIDVPLTTSTQPSLADIQRQRHAEKSADELAAEYVAVDAFVHT